MTYEAAALWHTLTLDGAIRWFDLPSAPRTLFAGVLFAAPGMPPSLHTGVWAGPITVDLTALPSRPEAPAGDVDLVVETSIAVQGGPFGPRGPEDHPSLVAEHGVRLAAGWVRMRVAATGRETAYDEAVEEAVEHYVIQVWPEEPSATVNLSTGERPETSGPVAPATDSGVRVEPVAVRDHRPIRG
ncbi:MAG TPA: hypothetical protein H9815_16185 [Candidatus Ruania gallistercoris]|uniref:Uncharacterized protein n=1 Tax=Candidatus Ruania gallistercoris TaxID=2838746 RepID=A0A9D2EHR8_9MICO|nr:hypothetical protein [Candidatus Ruania gallistercoris]